MSDQTVDQYEDRADVHDEPSPSDEDLLLDVPRAVSPHFDDWTPPPAPGPAPTSALRERLLRYRIDESS